MSNAYVHSKTPLESSTHLSQWQICVIMRATVFSVVSVYYLQTTTCPKRLKSLYARKIGMKHLAWSTTVSYGKIFP